MDAPSTSSSSDNPQPYMPSVEQTVNPRTPYTRRFTKHINRIKKRLTAQQGNDDVELYETPNSVRLWENDLKFWQIMIYNDEVHSHSRSHMLFYNSDCGILPHMRSILIEWIMEVCEAYRFRRATYYLTVDYVDRYLTLKPTIQKQNLQLLGITALFVAVKYEEVNVPKVSEFAYICDGAFTSTDILKFELVLVITLGWCLNTLTPICWLSLFMQIECSGKVPFERGFMHPYYSKYKFVRICHLIDLFSLDPNFLAFSYRVIAGSALWYEFGTDTTLKVTGFKWNQIEECVAYMSAFNSVINDSDDPRLHCVAPLDFSTSGESHLFITSSTSNHDIQNHLVTLKHFEESAMAHLVPQKSFIVKIEEMVDQSGTNTQTSTQPNVLQSDEQTESNNANVENELIQDIESDDSFEGMDLDDSFHQTESNGSESASETDSNRTLPEIQYYNLPVDVQCYDLDSQDERNLCDDLAQQLDELNNIELDFSTNTDNAEFDVDAEVRQRAEDYFTQDEYTIEEIITGINYCTGA